MKRIATQLFILFLLGILTQLNAQEQYRDIIERALTVNYIFEGIVIETNPYKITDDKFVYTSNVIQITKVFKGDLSCGTVELISEGGEVDDYKCRVSHNLNLEEGTSGLFLCNLTGKELSTVDFYSESNYQKLEAYYENQSLVRYSYENNKLVGYDLWQKIDSLAALYDMAKYVGQFQFVDCNNQRLLTEGKDRTTNPIVENVPPYEFPKYKKEDFYKINEYVEYKNKNWTRDKKGSRAPSVLTYTLSQPIVTGTGATKYVEFDVLIKDNLGDRYMDICAISIGYTPNMFGSNIVSNNKIEVTNGVINADTNCYFKVVVSDTLPNVFYAMITEKIYSQCKNNTYTYPRSILHVKMQIQDCNVNGAIGFYPLAIGSGFNFMDFATYADFPNDTSQTYYDQVIASDNKSINTCKMKILSLSPDTVNGGIGDTLYIRGYQFGSTQGSSSILMKDAGSGGFQPDIPLENSDVKYWSDTLIKIVVPSVDTGTVPQPVGSGKVRIRKSSTEIDSSASRLTVFYSLYNERIAAASVNKYNAHLYDETGSGGYKLYIDTGIYNNANAMGCVVKAVNEWVCATGVNLTIAGDTFGLPKTGTVDGINYVSFGTLGSPAKTYTRLANCSSNQSVNFIYDRDLIISNAYLWFYDSTGLLTVPQGWSDFYYTVLHELGHTIGLDHVIDTNAIMYFASPNPFVPGGVPANKRRVNIKVDLSCIKGGRKQVAISADPLNVNTCVNPIIPLPTCAGYTKVEDINPLNLNVTVFPNPFNNTLVVRSEKGNVIEANLYSIDGKIVSKANESLNEFELHIGSLNSLPKGLYLLEVITSNGKTFKKLIHE